MLRQVIASSWSVRVTYSELIFFKQVCSDPWVRRVPGTGLMQGECGGGQGAGGANHEWEKQAGSIYLKGQRTKSRWAAAWLLDGLVPAPGPWLVEGMLFRLQASLDLFLALPRAHSVSQSGVDELLLCVLRKGRCSWLAHCFWAAPWRTQPASADSREPWLDAGS